MEKSIKIKRSPLAIFFYEFNQFMLQSKKLKPERKNRMDAYGQRIFNRLAKNWKGSNYRIERVCETVLHVTPLWSSEPAVCTWMEEETNKIAEMVPIFDVCMVVYEDNEEKEHSLYIRFNQQEIRLVYRCLKDKRKLTLYCDANLTDTVFEHNFEFDRIRQIFKQLVEELPQYRLRIVTGEIELDDRTIRKSL